MYLPVICTAVVDKKKKVRNNPEHRLRYIKYINSGAVVKRSSSKDVAHRKYERRLSAPALDTQHTPSLGSCANTGDSFNKSNQCCRAAPLLNFKTRAYLVLLDTRYLPYTYGFRLVFFSFPRSPSASCTVFQQYDGSRSSRSAQGEMCYHNQHSRVQWYLESQNEGG